MFSYFHPKASCESKYFVFLVTVEIRREWPRWISVVFSSSSYFRGGSQYFSPFSPPSHCCGRLDWVSALLSLISISFPHLYSISVVFLVSFPHLYSILVVFLGSWLQMAVTSGYIYLPNTGYRTSGYTYLPNTGYRIYLPNTQYRGYI